MLFLQNLLLWIIMVINTSYPGDCGKFTVINSKIKSVIHDNYAGAVLRLSFVTILGNVSLTRANCSNNQEDMNQVVHSKSVESTILYDQKDCPDTFLDFKPPLEYCFKVIVDILPKSAALNECQKIGASLLVISSHDEYKSIRRVLHTDNLQISWIGLPLNGKHSINASTLYEQLFLQIS